MANTETEPLILLVAGMGVVVVDKVFKAVVTVVMVRMMLTLVLAKGRLHERLENLMENCLPVAVVAQLGDKARKSWLMAVRAVAHALVKTPPQTQVAAVAVADIILLSRPLTTLARAAPV